MFPETDRFYVAFDEDMDEFDIPNFNKQRLSHMYDTTFFICTRKTSTKVISATDNGQNYLITFDDLKEIRNQSIKKHTDICFNTIRERLTESAKSLNSVFTAWYDCGNANIAKILHEKLELALGSDFTVEISNVNKNRITVTSKVLN